jgi:O-antigen/teichoic acid export membrane protein
MNRKKILDYLQQSLVKLHQTGFSHIFGAGAVNKIVSFLSSIILIRILSKNEYGVFAYAYNILSFFLLFSGFGMVSGIFQLSSENYRIKEKALSFFRYGTRIAVRFNLGLAAGIFASTFILKLPIDHADILIRYMSLLPLFTVLYELIQIYLRFERRNRPFSYLTSTNTLLILLFSAVGALLWGTAGLIFFRYGAYLLTILAGIVLLKVPVRIKKREISGLTRTEKADLWKISSISMLNIATGRLLYLLDVFFVGLILLDEQILASYKVATLIPNALLFIPGALMMYVYPYFAEHYGDYPWVRKKYLAILGFFGLFNTVMVIFLFTLAPWIIKLVFGTAYLDAVLPFRILVVGYLISATVRKTTGNLLVTQRKLKFNLFSGICEGLINIGGNIILIPRFGSVGAAYSTLGVTVLSSMVSFAYFMHVTRSAKIDVMENHEG